MKIAVQMDPIETVDVRADTTFALIAEARERDAAISVFEPRNLIFDGARAEAVVRDLQDLAWEQGRHARMGEARRAALADFDVILIRQDPPFDMAYLTTTWILETLPKSTLVANDPRTVRDWPEKLFVMGFPDLMPETLVTRDRDAIKDFRDRHGDIVLKPLFLAGGAGVFRIRPDDENFNAVIESLTERTREPLIAQRYLRAVREGDKRVILIDGEPVGAINRIPAQGDSRSNMHVGGRAAESALDERDHEICARIGPALRDRGVILAGIDVIGGLLTEINITSPTGLQELKRFSGVDAAALFWDAVARRRARAL